ncbi:hypothetical protein ANCCEY_03429 [Ancylostoma ceylanicum]|uniref:Uncharacterized protein n=1 Tax=Ancylostoma ceylanicum TaxID=53326 RepID=A0A0D6M4Y5_9BILA|nr:hypothetical protein ANCCEY_03429 [Ancylostoma ceylanicum]
MKLVSHKSREGDGKSAKVRRHDDESLDDIAEMQKESRKRKEKDERISMDRRRRGVHDLSAYIKR